ncbi:MAG: hypothetical protein IJU40_05180, partial [Desulfovibrionaceae bacterium]|nr:hypothetical protein [Desulfovibrionaceae bacterium]
MTLQAKISFLVTSSVTIALVLAIFLTWKQVSDYILLSEEIHFTNIANNIEVSIESSFHEYLSAKVRVVLSTKRQIRNIVNDVFKDLKALEYTIPYGPEREKLRRRLFDNHLNEASSSNSETYKIMLTSSTDFIFTGFPLLGIPPFARDINKQYIGDIIANLPYDGGFFLWKDPKTAHQVLIFMLPIHPGSLQRDPSLNHPDRMVVAGISLNSLLKASEELLHERFNAIKQNFESIPFYPQGCLVFRDTSGTDLVKRGDDAAIAKYLPRLCKKARQENNVISHLETSHG